jgi:transcriptional regulator GlxA family with amidase domain
MGAYLFVEFRPGLLHGGDPYLAESPWDFQVRFSSRMPKVFQEHDLAIQDWEHDHTSCAGGRQGADVCAELAVGVADRVADDNQVWILIYDSSAAPLFWHALAA